MRGKGVGTRLLSPFTIPPSFALILGKREEHYSFDHQPFKAKVRVATAVHFQ